MNNSHLIPMPNEADQFLLEIGENGRASVRGPGEQRPERCDFNPMGLRWEKGIESPRFALLLGGTWKFIVGNAPA
jgi:hypothetical protein